MNTSPSLRELPLKISAKSSQLLMKCESFLILKIVLSKIETGLR